MTLDPLDPLEQRLREAAWRRSQLTPAEEQELQRWLSAHPEAQTEMETEAGLTDALERLPDAPVASNFTARVLQAVESDALRELQGRQRRARSGWRAWWPRAAVAMAAVVAAAGLWFTQHQQKVHQEQARREQARSIAVIAGVPSLPAPEVLQDFEAIRALKTTPVLRSDPRKTTAAADEQLLTLLQ